MGYYRAITGNRSVDLSATSGDLLLKYYVGFINDDTGKIEENVNSDVTLYLDPVVDWIEEYKLTDSNNGIKLINIKYKENDTDVERSVSLKLKNSTSAYSIILTLLKGNISNNYILNFTLYPSGTYNGEIVENTDKLFVDNILVGLYTEDITNLDFEFNYDAFKRKKILIYNSDLIDDDNTEILNIDILYNNLTQLKQVSENLIYFCNDNIDNVISPNSYIWSNNLITNFSNGIWENNSIISIQQNYVYIQNINLNKNGVYTLLFKILNIKPIDGNNDNNIKIISEFFLICLIFLYSMKYLSSINIL